MEFAAQLGASQTSGVSESSRGRDDLKYTLQGPRSREPDSGSSDSGRGWSVEDRHVYF